METKTTRVCFFCREKVTLEDDEFVYDGKKYFHGVCFIEKKTKNSRPNITMNEAVDLLVTMKEKYGSFTDSVILKNHLYMWIHKAYDLTFIPKYFYQKMAGVFDGTGMGLSKPIPVEHIFDMWRRKKKELDKINNRKKRIGSAIEGTNRLNYDLAVLLGKYDGYLRWKEKQEAASYNRKMEMEKRRDAISYKKIARNKVAEKNDISEILESI